MNCKKWQIIIMRKFDGAINESEDRDLSLHLKSCPHCRKLDRDLERILTGLEEQSPLDLKIDPKLEFTVMQAVHGLNSRRPTESGIIRLIYSGLGLVLAGIFLYIGSELVDSGFFNLLLKINDGISQITAALTRLEILYHILQPFVSQELTTLTQWISAIYKGALLVSIILLVQFVYTQRRCGAEDNYR